MGLKRKRNLKIDNTMNYRVCILRDLDSEYLEDYVEVHDSGMEADEEKEIQLQKIMQGAGNEIPLPVVRKIDNPALAMYKDIKIKKHIKWNVDCKNEYIEDATDAGKKMELKNPTEEDNAAGGDSIAEAENGQLSDEAIARAFQTFGEVASAVNNKNKRLVDYVLGRTLVRYERAGYEAYACFRRRVFHPTFKSRRNELIMLEKLERMGAEFQAQHKLCELLMKRCRAQHRHIRRTGRLLAAYAAASLSKKEKRAYKRKILGLPDDDAPSKVIFNVHSIMTNRNKIAYIKGIKSSVEMLIDSKYYKEAMAILKYKESLGGACERSNAFHADTGGRDAGS